MLHLVGWRFLVEGTCPACGHRLLQDLPSGHALVYPTTLDLDTGEAIDAAQADWFARWLKPYYEAPDADPVGFAVERRQATERPLVVNCLDPVYGHSVLKLVGAARFSAPAGDWDGCVAVLPRALAEVAPASIHELWVVEERVGRLGRWLLDLEARLRDELGRFAAVGLAPVPPHPHPATYDLDELAPDARAESVGSPSLVLSLRDDRRWGAQEASVGELMDAVRRAFPDVRAAAVGPGTPGGLPDDVIDLRDHAPTPDRELRWVSLMRGADLAVGVHGSNLLLPSGFAAATVELVPEGRYGNLFQATLLAQRDPLLALDRHRVVYGSDDLTDVTGAHVARIAIAVLQGAERFAQLMTGPAAGEYPGPMPRLAPGVPAPQPRPAAPTATDRARAAVAGLADRVAGRPAAREATERQREDAVIARLGERVVEVMELDDHEHGTGDARRRVERAWGAGLTVHRVDDDLTPMRVAGSLAEPSRVIVLRTRPIRARSGEGEDRA